MSISPQDRIVLVLERTDGQLSEQVKHHGGERTTVLRVHSGPDAVTAVHTHRVTVIFAQDSLPPKETQSIASALLMMTSPPPLVVIEGEDSSASHQIATELADYVFGQKEMARTLPFIVNHAAGTADLEDKVAASEQQYRDLIEASNDAVYIFVDSHFDYANPRFCELFGYHEEDLRNQNFDFRTLVHLESLPLVEARVAGVKRGQPMPSRYEFRALRKDGTAFDVEVSVSQITYNGRRAALGILQDITARKAYEKALLRKNHELSVLNAVAEAITQVNDLASVLDAVMERLIELLGVDAAGLSLLDDDDPNCFSSVHYRGCSETFVQCMRVRAPSEGVLGLALATKRLQIIDELELDERIGQGASVQEGFRSAVALPLINQDRVCGVVNVFTRTSRTFAIDDIRLFQAVAHQLAVAIDNARLYREAQEGMRRLEALSQIGRAISSTLDVEGVFQIVGQRLGPLVPFRRISLLIARKDARSYSVRMIDRPEPGKSPKVAMMEALHTREGSGISAALAQVGPTLLNPGEVKDSLLAPNPECATAVIPIRADQINIGLFVLALPLDARLRKQDLALLSDLAAHLATSLKNARMFQELQAAYLELKDAKDQLVRSEKLHGLGEMAAGVAHDFNNVLSAILGRAQMMQVLLRDPEMQKNLRVIEKAALDGAGTVRRIQEFAKVKSDMAFVPVRLNPVVRDVVERCAPRADAHDGPLQCEVDLGEPPVVFGNPAELREVLTNVIHNALDAMPHGGRLSVSTGRSSDAEAYVEVQDTGIGMDPEVQNKIFDPFFTTKGAQGTGLGMSVSYGIVQRHQGQLTVRSARGAGTCIRIALPSTAAPSSSGLVPDPPDLSAEDPWLDEVKTPPPPRIVPNRKTARILVIDDDVAVRDVLSDILRAGNHIVSAAGSGEEAMKLFSSAEFDVVFTDLGMPGMNGWEVARAIKAQRPGTPVGLITGWGSNLDEADVAKHGVDLVVPKPFRFEQVLEVVNVAISLGERLG